MYINLHVMRHHRPIALHSLYENKTLNLNENVYTFCIARRWTRILSCSTVVQTPLLLRTVPYLTIICYVHYPISWLVKSSWELCWLQLQFTGWEKQRVRKSGSSTQSPAWAPGKRLSSSSQARDSQTCSTINTHLRHL